MEIKEFILNFNEKLRKLDKTEKSKLRRCMKNPSTDVRIMDILVRLEPGAPEWARKYLDIVAVIFAAGKYIKQVEDENFNYGRCLKKAAFPESRMRALLNASEGQLYFKLRQAMKFVDKTSLFVDWRIFASDLIGWGHPDKYIQRKWAEGFFV